MPWCRYDDELRPEWAQVGSEVGVALAGIAFNPSIDVSSLTPLVVSRITDGSMIQRAAQYDFPTGPRTQCKPKPAPHVLAAPLEVSDLASQICPLL